MNTNPPRSNLETEPGHPPKKVYNKKLPQLLSHSYYKLKDLNGYPTFLVGHDQQLRYINFLEQDFKPHLSRNLHAKLCLWCCQFYSPMLKKSEHQNPAAFSLGTLIGRSKANPARQLKVLLTNLSKHTDELYDAGWVRWDKQGTITAFRPFLFTQSPRCVRPRRIPELSVHPVRDVVEVVSTRVEPLPELSESSIDTDLEHEESLNPLNQSKIEKLKQELRRITKKKHNYKVLFKRDRKGLKEIAAIVNELLN